MRKISEGTVVIGLLALFSFWLFVGLPFFYLPLKFKCLDGCSLTVSASGGGYVLSFVSGSVMAWILGQISTRYQRPIMNAKLVPNMGCYVTTMRGNPPTHPAKFLRLLVENAGRSPIKGCTAYILGISRIVKGVRVDDQREVLELHWSQGGRDQQRTIPRGAFYYVDVASLDVVGTYSVLGLCLRWTPNHMMALASGRYELAVRVVAENLPPVNRIVVFDFDSTKADLQFRYD